MEVKTRIGIIKCKTFKWRAGTEISGVYVHTFLKVAGQVNKLVTNVYWILAFINRGMCIKVKTFTNNWFGLRLLYSFLNTTFLEGHQGLWRVQGRFSGIIPGMGDFNYVEKLENLGFFILDQGSLRGDIMQR